MLVKGVERRRVILGYNRDMSTPIIPETSSDVAVTAIGAHDYGRKLFLLLQASSLSDQEKAAWSELLPILSLAETDRLMALLEKNLTTQIAEEFEDVFLKLKAAQAKRDLSLSALDLRTEQELAALEKELTQGDKV